MLEAATSAVKRPVTILIVPESLPFGVRVSGIPGRGLTITVDRGWGTCQEALMAERLLASSGTPNSGGNLLVRARVTGIEKYQGADPETVPIFAKQLLHNEMGTNHIVRAAVKKVLDIIGDANGDPSQAVKDYLQQPDLVLSFKNTVLFNVPSLVTVTARVNVAPFVIVVVNLAMEAIRVDPHILCTECKVGPIHTIVFGGQCHSGTPDDNVLLYASSIVASGQSLYSPGVKLDTTATQKDSLIAGLALLHLRPNESLDILCEHSKSTVTAPGTDTSCLLGVAPNFWVITQDQPLLLKSGDDVDITVPSDYVASGCCPIVFITESTGHDVQMRQNLVYRNYIQLPVEQGEMAVFVGIVKLEEGGDSDGTFSLSYNYVPRQQRLDFEGTGDTSFTLSVSQHEMFTCSYCRWPFICSVLRMPDIDGKLLAALDAMTCNYKTDEPLHGLKVFCSQLYKCMLDHPDKNLIRELWSKEATEREIDELPKRVLGDLDEDAKKVIDKAANIFLPYLDEYEGT